MAIRENEVLWRKVLVVRYGAGDERGGFGNKGIQGGITVRAFIKLA